MEDTMYIKGGEGTVRYYASHLLVGFEWKIIASTGASILAMMEGFYTDLLWGFLALFMLDFVTGIMKSYKNGVPISSRRLRNSVTKLASYMVLITSLIIASRFETSLVPIVTCLYYFFIFTELKSIIENARAMGVPIPDILNSTIDAKLSEVQQTTEETKQAVADVDNKVDEVDTKVDEVNHKVDVVVDSIPEPKDSDKTP